jgi:hypothetical protein
MCGPPDLGARKELMTPNLWRIPGVTTAKKVLSMPMITFRFANIAILFIILLPLISILGTKYNPGGTPIGTSVRGGTCIAAASDGNSLSTSSSMIKTSSGVRVSTKAIPIGTCAFQTNDPFGVVVIPAELNRKAIDSSMYLDTVPARQMQQLT